MNPAEEDQISRAVRDVIGNDNALPDHMRRDQRDPWIAEGIGHLAIWLSRRATALAVRGRIQALMPLHVQSKEQGLDLSALYSDALDLGLTIGEAKASETNATRNVAAAAGLFSEIDAGDAIREVQMRDRVQLLREALRPEHDVRVTASLWQEHRCYMPIVAYGTSSSFAPTRARSTFGGLSPGVQHVLLVCLSLGNYRTFFDQVANAMRAVL
jgi:hypothetical protein